MKKAIKDLPDWGEIPKRPGLYLSLSHGRSFPQEAMRSRGFAGPKLGPLLYVKTKYGQEITIRFASHRDAKKYFPETTFAINTMQIVEGTLVFDEQCFGEWDICHIAPEFCRS